MPATRLYICHPKSCAEPTYPAYRQAGGRQARFNIISGSHPNKPRDTPHKILNQIQYDNFFMTYDLTLMTYREGRTLFVPEFPTTTDLRGRLRRV